MCFYDTVFQKINQRINQHFYFFLQNRLTCSQRYAMMMNVDIRSTDTKRGWIYMTNTIEFEVAVLRSGKPRDVIAKAIGLSRTSMSYKANNIREWTAGEILRFKNYLGLADTDVITIFFADSVDKISTKCANKQAENKNKLTKKAQ